MNLSSSVAVYSQNSYLYFLVKHVNVASNPHDIAFYVGVLFAVFLASQSIMGPFWGWLSDRVGRRKPFVLSGAFGTALGFVLLGLSETYETVLQSRRYAANQLQAICAQILIGMLNNLSEIMPTIIGEISDFSNRGPAFAYLPIFNWLGAVIGPLIGGFLSNETHPVIDEGARSISHFPYVSYDPL